MKDVNPILRFALELCTLAAFVYWGFATEDGPAALLRGFGVALLTVAVWGTFGAPGALLRATLPVRLMLLAVIYGWAVTALWTTNHHVLAIALGAAAAVNTGLMLVLGQV